VTEGHRLRDHGGGGRRGWRVLAAAGVLVAVLAVVVALVVVANHDDQSSAIAGPASSSLPSAPPVTGSTTGPKPPASGAYLGSSVQPVQDYTETGRIGAVRGFESEVGRQLDIVHTYHTWDDEFPSQADKWVTNSDRMLLLSWAGTDTRVIQSGRYDAMIRARARAVRNLGVPIFLEWRWEMDRPNLQASIWSPQDYIAAWRHIRAIFAQEKATAVSWVWCPTADGFTQGRAAAYYPGDTEVDWVCADVYPGPKDQDFGTNARAFLDWAKQHPTKPAMIGEFGASDQFPGGQTAWLDQARQTARANPQIKALVYWDSNEVEKGPRARLSLRGSPASVDAFRTLLAEPYFNSRRLPVSR
jgi:hypothetical protein